MKYKQNILVTGGCGFIGSHLVDQLIIQGHCVTIVDNLTSGSKKYINKDATYFYCDTNDLPIFGNKFDIIFHLAEFSRVENSFEYFDTVIQSNLYGTQKIIDLSLQHGAKLIYAGSSTKFGEFESNSLKSPYVLTKEFNTKLVKNVFDYQNHPYAIVYFYNVYGPREIEQGAYETVVGKFLRLQRNKQNLTVVRPGNQERNFTHVFDTINALLLIMENGEGDGFGIGNDTSITIHDLAKLISDKIELVPERHSNRTSAKVYSEKTKMLGWNATIQLKDYIQNHVQKYIQ